MNLGQHAGFIIAAYAIAAMVIVALIAWVTADHRRQRAILHDLEVSGLKRRSARPAAGPS